MRPDKIPRLALGITKAWIAKKKFHAIRKTENKKILSYKVQNFAAEDLRKLPIQNHFQIFTSLNFQITLSGRLRSEWKNG